MPINFGQPTESQTVAARNTSSRDNQLALAKWLEGESVTGAVAGIKRLNGGVIQEWNGTAWVEKSVAYLKSSQYTAADVLAKLLTVDGPGSGLDADLLDGQHGAYYTNASNLASGTVPSARVSGAYTGITQVGTLSSLTVTNDLVVDAGNAQGRLFVVGGDATFFNLRRNTGAANEKNWVFIFNGSSLRLAAYDDAFGSPNTAFQFDRSGINVTKGHFSANSFDFNVNADAAISVSRPSAGTYNYLRFLTGGVRRGYIGANPDNNLEIGSDGTTISCYTGSGIALHLRRGASLGSSFHCGAYTDRVSVTFSATPSFNAATSNYFELGTLTGNVTSMTISNASIGQTITIRVQQDATGGRTVAGPSGAKITGSVSATANAASFLTITYTGANRWEGSWLGTPA